MREQARRAGVPPATMTRLAKRLGLEGYDEVRELYAGAVRDGTLGFASKAASRSRARSCAASGRSRPRLAMTLSRQIARLAETPALDRLADAAGRLHQARRIYCLGLRSVTPPPGIFTTCFSAGDKTVMLDDAGGIGLDAFAMRRGRRGARRQVEPYARATIEGARYAHLQGVPVVALTDSEVSPLAARGGDDPRRHRQPVLLPHHDASALPSRRSWRPGGRPLRPERARALTRAEAQLAAFGVHLPRRGAEEIMTASCIARLRHGCPSLPAAKASRSSIPKGKRYLDASGGAAVSAWVTGIGSDRGRCTRSSTGSPTPIPAFHHEWRRSSRSAGRDAPGDLGHVYLVSGGSEAVEAALKNGAPIFYRARRDPAASRHRRRQSYHGNTLARLPPEAMPGGARLRALLIETHHIERASPIAFRKRAKPGRSTAGAPRCAGAADPRAWRDTVLAFVAGDGGRRHGRRGNRRPRLLRRVREICDRYGVLLISSTR